jgi:hypothetical protein
MHEFSETLLRPGPLTPTNTDPLEDIAATRNDVAREPEESYLKYLHLPEERSALNAGFNRATAIMLAAANLNTKLLHTQIQERKRHPLRAAAEEHGLDMALIEAEVSAGRKRQATRDWVCLALFLVGILVASSQLEQVSEDSAGYEAFKTLGIFFIGMVGMVFQHRLRAKARVREIFRRCESDDSLYRAEYKNVVISGGYSPFVGAGAEVSAWSFTINLAKPDHAAREVRPLAIADLYRETEEALAKLPISGLELKDELFVDGRDVRRVPCLFDAALRERPKTEITTAELGALAQSNHPKIRHYRVIRAQLWGGQVVLSTYLKYRKLGDTLFVETRMRVLSPLDEKFAAHESLPVHVSAKGSLKDLGYSLIAATVIWLPPLLTLSHFVMGGFMELLANPHARNRKAIDTDRRYNFGWPISLRELWSGGSYERYFQMVDNDFHTKMIKETLLDSLIDSLEKRNICTTTLSEATTKIFNEGVILTGGAINAKTMAVGKGAAATMSSMLSGKKASSHQST